MYVWCVCVVYCTMHVTHTPTYMHPNNIHASIQHTCTPIHPKHRLQNRTLNASFSDRAADDVSNRVDIKSVYVGNLPSGADEEGLRELFNGLGQGQVTKVIIPQPRPGKEFSEYGFVHFESHSAAVGVWEVSETQELTLKGNKLTVG